MEGGLEIAGTTRKAAQVPYKPEVPRRRRIFSGKAMYLRQCTVMGAQVSFAFADSGEEQVQRFQWGEIYLFCSMNTDTVPSPQFT